MKMATAGIVMLSSVALISCSPALRGKDVPLAQDTGTQPRECEPKAITKVTSGTQPVYAQEGRLIVFVRVVDGNFEIFRMRADGSDQRCLTCGNNPPKELRGKHKGVPDVGANGQYIVFIAENAHASHRFINTPGFGEDNDFWAMDMEGKAYWRLTTSPARSMIQFPRFSFDGKRFAWSDRQEVGSPLKKGSEYGAWRIRTADFVITPAGPKFENVANLVPAGKGYYEPHGWSPDQSKMIFTAMVNPDRSQYYGELFTYDVASRRLTNLATADDLHFEQAVFTPSGKKISFMSGPFIGLTRFGYKTDLYLMDADGKNRVRLTGFNDAKSPQYTGADTLMNKHDWHPDGTKLVGAYYIHAKNKELSLFTITFAGPCGRL